MIMAIAYDIRIFLLIIAITLIGFSQALYLLSQHDQHLPFGTITQSLLSCFDYMMGNFETQIDGSLLPSLTTFIIILFILFMIILMLNLLIALMGNTFNIISEKGLAQWRKEQITILLDEEFLISRKERIQLPSYLFILMYTIDYENSIEHFINEKNEDNTTVTTNNSNNSVISMSEHQLLHNKINLLDEKINNIINKLEKITGNK